MVIIHTASNTETKTILKNALSMTQIKLFNQKTPYLEEFEKSVNAFLDENKDKIKVIDIKYTAVHPNLSNSIWVAWTAMVIYENLE